MKRIIFIAIGILIIALVAANVYDVMQYMKYDNIKTTDQRANRATKALYANLKTNASKGVMFGHQDDLAYGIGWKREKGRSDIKDVCGDYPAIYGWEIAWLGISEHNLDTVNFDNMRRWMVEAYERGGINTISWHLNNLASGGSAWDTTSCVKHILPNGSKHSLYLQRLDALAEYFKSIRPYDTDKAVPIIFRPFHEHTGSWFWWGKGNTTAEDYKALWRFTVDYLKDTREVHNVLYAYSTDVFKDSTQYLEFYPGNDYVDILGVDNYHHMKNPDSLHHSIRMLETINDLAQSRDKVAAFSETGVETVPMSTWWTDMLLKSLKANEKTRNIAYAMVWRNAIPSHHYGPHKGHQSAPNFVEFYKDEFTIFEKDLPNMYKL